MFRSLEAFQKAAKTEMKTPEGTMKMLIGALLVIEKDKNLATQMICVLFSKKSLRPDKKSPLGVKPEPSIIRLIDHLRYKPNIAKSYAGGTPKNGYECDVNNPKVPIIGVDYNEGKTQVKLILQSSGKGANTPIKLGINKEGLWKLLGGSGGFSSIATDVRKPEEDPLDI
ncbi:MAG: DUF6935 domain-containing protein [Candidatus Helarchaeota archaeon]